jgi:hypothetical protein
VILVDHPFYVAIQEQLVKHSEAILEALLALLVAIGLTIPEVFPKSFQDFWSWGRAAIHVAMPMRQLPPSNPNPPPAEPPKQ